MNSSLILSIAALVLSGLSAVYARMSAVAARRSAGAEEENLAIERARRLEERRPRLTAAVEGQGQRVLRITLDSDEPLVGLDVTIKEWNFEGKVHHAGGWDFEFNPRVYGVVVPRPGEPAVRAFCYDPHGGERGGLKPHESITWAVDTKDGLKSVRLDVVCHGSQGERWDLVLNAPAQPHMTNTIA